MKEKTYLNRSGFKKVIVSALVLTFAAGQTVFAGVSEHIEKQEISQSNRFAPGYLIKQDRKHKDIVKQKQDKFILIDRANGLQKKTHLKKGFL